MRQHVNPLSRFFQLPIELPSPEELFPQPNQPIHLDIGSARGKFLIEMAEFQLNWNFLGVEIRETLVKSANAEIQAKDQKNIKFLFCNANISLDDWLSKLPNNLLKRVTIQFPDPWFKRRHFKRRVLNPSLLISLSRKLPLGAELFIQSDVKNVIQPMRILIESSSYFYKQKGVNGEINYNPYLFKTEREKYALKKGLQIYRTLYKRNSQSIQAKN